MTVKTTGTDYLYGSARIRALENRLIGRERLERMLEQGSSEGILATLSDYGITPIRAGGEGTGAILREETLCGALAEGYAELASLRGAGLLRGPVDFLRYPYDCNHIKAQIKCFSRGIDGRALMTEGLGTLACDDVVRAFDEKQYGIFPEEMAKAIPAAEEAFAKTGNPQTVDLILDRACFADMLSVAKESGNSYVMRLVETKIDLTNLATCVRLIRMKLAAAMSEAMLAEAYIEGGILERSLLEDALREGEAWLFGKLYYTRYGALSTQEEAGLPLGELEKRADDLWMTVAEEAKYVPFGIEPLIGYAIALETQIKNIRIILAAKDAGLSSERIRERLRKSYV